ncbi:hypothetical protein GCM10027082_24640 [Comamonas humi]
MRRLARQDPEQVRRGAVQRPSGKLTQIARALYEPPVTEAEARSEGFELEDYETEVLEVWPDNERALAIFDNVGTRWLFPSMGGSPIGLRWEAIYPLMDRLNLSNDDWNSLHDDLMVMEVEALKTMREFAPKPDKTK